MIGRAIAVLVPLDAPLREAVCGLCKRCVYVADTWCTESIVSHEIDRYGHKAVTECREYTPADADGRPTQEPPR